MELYLHIPFCAAKCRYCDFASYAGCTSRMPAYVDALLKEMSAQADALGHPVVETVFIGGGTPSLLRPDELRRILQGVHDHFDIRPDAEFTAEANPGTLTAEWLDVAVSGGLNRLSMGMQAFQPELLRLLGRIHRFDQVESSLKLARAAGIANVSLDLMFGLPTQTEEQWCATLDAACALSPQHLSCYGLIPEDGTPLKHDLDAGILTLPDEEAERRMYDDTLRLLAQRGYRQYEISNFSLPGYECRHNLGYWRQIPYIGLGAAASSMLPDADGRCSYLRVTNPAGLDEYIRMIDDHSDARETVEVSPKDARFETVMLGLRTTQGVSEAAFRQMHGCTMDACWGNTLRRLASDGLLIREDGCWRLTRRGMDVQNAVLIELMDEEPAP